MCDKYKINIKKANENIEVEGSSKEWVEGNAKQFLEKIDSGKINNDVIGSRILKILIGVLYLIISLTIFFASWRYISLPMLQKFLFCFAFGGLGLFGRTFIYYGFLRKDQNRVLYNEDIWHCLRAYFLYYLAGLLAVISFIFIAFYKNLEKMDMGLFICVALFLFTAIGFAVLESLEHFLLKLGKK